jgi:dihydrofolate reductase
VEIAASLEDALQIAAAAGDDDVFIVGGAELYRVALPRAGRLFLTRVHTDIAGDTHFPQLDLNEWRLTASEHHEADARNDYSFSFEMYERK